MSRSLQEARRYVSSLSWALQQQKLCFSLSTLREIFFYPFSAVFSAKCSSALHKAAGFVYKIQGAHVPVVPELCGGVYAPAGVP